MFKVDHLLQVAKFLFGRSCGRISKRKNRDRNNIQGEVEKFSNLSGQARGVFLVSRHVNAAQTFGMRRQHENCRSERGVLYIAIVRSLFFYTNDEHMCLFKKISAVGGLLGGTVPVLNLRQGAFQVRTPHHDEMPRLAIH